MDIYEIEEREKQALCRELSSEKFCSDRRAAIQIVEGLLWKWNREEQVRQGRMPLKAVNGRMKTPESILEKLERKGYEISLQSAERLHDLAGVRAVCSYLDDIYHLREFILEYQGISVLKEKDYIAVPKKSGYQSLHMILKTEQGIVELQIRTVAMDCWSNLEHAIIYKKGNYADGRIGKEFSAYAGFLRRIDGALLAMRIKSEIQ